MDCRKRDQPYCYADQAGHARHPSRLVFSLQGDNLAATEFDKTAWPNGLTLKRAESIGATTAAAPAGTTSAAATPTPAPGSLEGTYIASGPAADASALLWTVTFAPGGNISWLSNYVGKGTTNATGTWTQTSPTTVDVTLIHRDDKNIQETFTFEAQGDKLVATQYSQSLYGANGITLYKADTAVKGSVSYTQKLALPDDAVVEVYLLDTSKTDAPATYVSGISYSTGGKQVPLDFEVPYDSAQIQASGRYVVQAFISSAGRLLFQNQNGVAVITGGAPTSGVQLTVDQVGQ